MLPNVCREKSASLPCYNKVVGEVSKYHAVLYAPRATAQHPWLVVSLTGLAGVMGNITASRAVLQHGKGEAAQRPELASNSNVYANWRPNHRTLALENTRVHC